ncbi:WD repeat-containing protein 46-like [Oppia nitens]|uniref:WD repeat-containing protein 46-like n=1 Tax=Oppia nitens TaxID=1686743 RepID=UPI0023DCE6D7|nr:WD repeat-containing protein 46-like [Oppia nitens]
MDSTKQKKTMRYFVDKVGADGIDVNALMMNESMTTLADEISGGGDGGNDDLKRSMKKKNNNKVVNEWKDPQKRVQSVFANNRFVGKDKLMKYERKSRVNSRLATKYQKHRKRIRNEEEKRQNSIGFAARSELLLPETSGYLEADDNEETYQITQREIVDSIDITSATKHFDLNLDQLGHYFINYYRNGRQLLLGGQRGHVAAIDWITKELMCEFNVQESVHDVHWLHMPTLFAVAQKDWVHIYDNRGTQIHCIKKMYRVYKLDYLHYHFLLVSVSDNGFISWLDVSTGQMVASTKMKIPRVTAVKHNPYNAIVATAHPNGTVDMWSPNQKEKVVSMLCHGSAIRDIAFDCEGQYMVSAGVDRTMKVWDIRNFKCLNSFRLRSMPSNLDVSQRGFVGVSVGDVVEVYNNCFRQTLPTAPYMRHRFAAHVSDLEFCNFEDILGVGHKDGFTSLIIPGSGEPNFDALEANPYMTSSQRKEMEVKALLEKIPSELISLEPNILGQVDKESLKKQMEDKKDVKYVKPKDIEFESKPRKRRQKTAKKEKIKKGLNESERQQKVRDIVRQKTSDDNKQDNEDTGNQKSLNVLDRFKSKTNF